MSEIIPEDVLIEFDQQNKRISTLAAWNIARKRANNIYKRAEDALGESDPRFNSIFWAFHVWTLLKEIAHGYCWMRAWAKHYKQNVGPQDGLSHNSPHASYYASDCMIRIHSCRDKLSIMALAYYLPLNPESEKDVHGYWQNKKKLKRIERDMSIAGQKDFLPYLETLKGRHFHRVETYRNRKIHRREPIIEMYGAAPHHDWPYVFPLEDIEDCNRRMLDEYPDPGSRARIIERCKYNGILYETRKVKDVVWDYDEIDRVIESCFLKLLEAAAGCFHVLLWNYLWE